MQLEEKKFVWDSKMKHKIELMIILLIITVIGNITVYYFNHRYENNGQYAKSEEVVKEPTLTPEPTETSISTTEAIIRDCKLYKTASYTLCLPNNWQAIVKNSNEVQFQPKSVPASTITNYLTIDVMNNKLLPIPTPLKTYTEYRPFTVGTVKAYRNEYIPQKSKDGFIVPLSSGCQDPVQILVASKKNLFITTCKQYEDSIKPILDSILIQN